MEYRAVLFDLDGTLLDSLEDLADSMNAVLSESGLPRVEVDRREKYGSPCGHFAAAQPLTAVKDIGKLR